MAQGYVGRPFGRPFSVPLPFVDQIHGTSADVVRHLIARATFMREFCAEPSVVSAWERWGHESGIFGAAREYAEARDTYAKALGFRSRTDMMLPQFAERELLARIDGVDVDHVSTDLIDAEVAYQRVQREFDLRFDPIALAGDLWPEVTKRNWGLWVALDLVGACHRGVLSYSLGAAVVRQFRVSKSRGAGCTSRTWIIESSYTIDDDENAQLMIFPAKDGSRLPSEKVHAIERDARWFFRCRFGGEKLDDVTREFCDREQAQHHNSYHAMRGHEWQSDRKTVFDGIKKTEKILSLVIPSARD